MEPAQSVTSKWQKIKTARFIEIGFIKNTVLFLLFSIVSTVAFAQWQVKFIPDYPEMPTAEDIDALDKQAKAGDWQMKSNFAAAYLYALPQLGYKGCAMLTYGHICRAMASRSSAKVFLQEILDVDVQDNKPISLAEQSAFQEDYGFYQFQKARPDFLSGDACKETIYYLEKAADAELKQRGMCSHAALRLLYMAESGLCLPKGDTRFEKYKRKVDNCPMP